MSFSDLLIIANGLAMLIRVMESSDSLQNGARNFSASWDTFLFLSCRYYHVKIVSIIKNTSFQYFW